MRHTLISTILLCVFLSGCNTDRQPQPDVSIPVKKVWVFAQFNVPEENEHIESYWYYGQIPESLYADIASNQVQQGFLQLTNIHYWGDDDAIHAYEDDDDAGEMLFRIEDIRKVNRIKRLPTISEQHEHIVENLESDNT